MTTQFVEMYHPNIPSTAVTPALVALQAVDEQYAHGWLLVDPAAPPPVVNTPYYTKAASDSRYVQDWAGAETVVAGAIRMAPDGHVIVRTANGTTRSSYDATEKAAWTVVGGGGAVASVVGQTGAVTGAQIAADVALRAAFDAAGAAAAAQTAAQQYAAGAAAGLALVFGA